MLSGIQHFAFCKRQWALIHIEQQWSENGATAEGQLLHERADDPEFTEKRGDIIITRAVPVSSEVLGLSGRLDVLEFHRDAEGIRLEGWNGTWQPNIVEYKRGHSKPDERDAVQLMAQAICIEEKYGCILGGGDIFYNETRKRERIEFTAALREKTYGLAKEMHRLFREGKTPEAAEHRRCSLCSLKDICMPRITKKRVSVENYMRRMMGGEEDA